MKARLLLLLGSVVASLLCAEVAMRFVSTRHGRFVPHPVLGHANTSNSDFFFSGLRVCTGEDGCILSPRESGNGLDLLVVGDSFAAGQSANWGEGCIEVLSEKMLYTTINLGTAGYGTDHCLLRLREYLPRKPKTVLYLLCFNDLRDNIECNNHGMYKPRFALQDGVLVQTDWPKIQNRILLNSALCGVIHRKLFPQVLHPLEAARDKPHERAELAAKLIEQMELESQALGARFVVISHWLATEKAPEEDFSLLMQKLKERGTPLLILNEVIPLGDHYDEKRWHWNAKGHELVGEKIVDYLQAGVYESPQSPQTVNIASQPTHASASEVQTLRR
jgi:hypothetical protein